MRTGLRVSQEGKGFQNELSPDLEFPAVGIEQLFST